MKRPTDEVLLAFLEGTLGTEEREALLDQLDADPELATELRAVAFGMEAASGLRTRDVAPARADVAQSRGVSPYWVLAASIATLLISVPLTMQFSSRAAPLMDASVPGAVEPAARLTGGLPQNPEASYMVVLHGTWPDATELQAGSGQARAQEYWAWATELADEGVLIAAGDLRWEPGERLGPLGVATAVSGSVVDDPDYLVGVFTLRVDTYEEAVAIARDCPHLKYGGSVSVRRVGVGFVTVPGMSDWTD